MKYTINPKVDIVSGDITLTESIYDSIAGAEIEVSKSIVRTRDKATRAALIAMGWTPPSRDQRETPSAVDRSSSVAHAYKNGKAICGSPLYASQLRWDTPGYVGCKKCVKIWKAT